MDVTRTGHRYPAVSNTPVQPNYPETEERILEYWTRDETFASSVENNRGKPEYVFYDGPPFANGLPHYGHLLTGFVKDVLPRFETMRGRLVERRFGWDCHGLPAETEAERELGVSGRGPIVEFGIAQFNDFCRISVLRYAHAWERYVTRQGRWVDFENDYKTMDPSFMESVMWAFATLYRKGLIYEGYRVLPYCWECETPLSNFETRQDDAYRDRIDLAVTVAFELTAPENGEDPLLPEGTKLLVWTTTPWTLPSNLAIAVGSELSYSVLEKHCSRYVIGTDRLDAYGEEFDDATVLGTIPGSRLLGRHYRPLFSYFADRDAFRVLAGDFVTTEDGTGIVHLAPAFGEDDQRTCEEAGIAIVNPVDDRGRFDSRIGDLEGLQVFDANGPITDWLETAGALIRSEEYVHSYPHCWRTDTPLIYRAVSSFFVEVTKVKDRMIELNREINWVPAHVRDGAFGHWLEGARDWSISRNRFWGAPIPVWKSDDPDYPRVDVYASLDEIERDFGIRPRDLHRPEIDDLVRPNPDDPTGRSQMVRVTDVLDCWFESGSMPFAQLHYPFENRERFETHFPADFICEYIGQTRGWFYTLHVLATALFDRPAFKNVLAHGVVLGNDGRKLSKRLKNYPDPEEFFATEGADAMRWYLVSSAVLRGNDVAIEEHAMSEPIRQILNPIWNSWYFLCLYAETDGWIGTYRTDQRGALDRYVLAKLAGVVREVTSSLENYDLAGATATIAEFLDALTNWYVRRSRDRFWRPVTGDETLDADKRDAYDTLHTVLHVLCRVAAPFLPFLTEAVYRELTGERSVHLTKWPAENDLPLDDELVSAMDLVRAVCSAGHSIRKAVGLRARLPLASLTFAGPGAKNLEPFRDLIAEELNVKHVELDEHPEAHSVERLRLIPSILGPRVGEKMQNVMAAFRKGDYEISEDAVLVGGERLFAGEYELSLAPRNETSSRILAGNQGVLVLDIETTPELELEGTARDIVRVVQQERRNAGLHLSDRIHLVIVGDKGVEAVIDRFGDEVASQTLATSVEFRIGKNGAHELSGGRTIDVAVTRAEDF